MCGWRNKQKNQFSLWNANAKASLENLNCEHTNILPHRVSAESILHLNLNLQLKNCEFMYKDSSMPRGEEIVVKWSLTNTALPLQPHKVRRECLVVVT
jgi:hypothetical protein